LHSGTGTDRPALTCYVVRHGTAAPGSDDRARPLTPAGRAEVEATARALAAHGVAVDEIRHSGLARARETAEILGRILAPPRGIHATRGLGPEDDPDVAAAELTLTAVPVLLVGHLPHLARLAAMLVGADELERVQFTPGTAVGLRREAQSWALGLVVSPPAGGGAP
jgi:phosphohistidine phosphatase